MTPEEIAQRCHFDRMRFVTAFGKLQKNYPEINFTKNIQDCFSELFGIIDKGAGNLLIKSEAYQNYYMEENGAVDLRGINPFYVIRFSNDFAIDLIFLSIEECKSNSLLTTLAREEVKESSTIIAFDLFAVDNNFSFSQPKKP